MELEITDGEGLLPWAFRILDELGIPKEYSGSEFNDSSLYTILLDCFSYIGEVRGDGNVQPNKYGNTVGCCDR